MDTQTAEAPARFNIIISPDDAARLDAMFQVLHPGAAMFIVQFLNTCSKVEITK
jgi:hypothetical protein